ncbi:hypothetical protein DYQ86_20925 [Acidobacteria bacterium AB60]|nr:hypothetical protein DYQ86_20925 [Acidobacteria bacterium AB60]
MAKRASIAILVVALLLAIPLAYSTAQGYTMWWFPSGGFVTVDGVPSGYLHKNWQGTEAIITRTDSKPSQSYLVVFTTSKTSKAVFHCGDWHARHFFVFPIGEVNPPCSPLLGEAELQRADVPLNSTLSVTSGVIEFSTVRGKKVNASW